MELNELDGSYVFKDITAGEYFIKVIGMSIENHNTDAFALEEGEEKIITFYGVDAGLQKEFFDDQLPVQLSADGIVQKFSQGTMDYQNLDFNILSEWEAPTISARVTWKFGNRYLQNRENRRSRSAAERQGAQGE